MPTRRSATIGLRLWGMAEEPFWPSANGSPASRTSVRWRWRTSVARRSTSAPATARVASRAAWRSRATTWVGAGSAGRPGPARTPGPLPAGGGAELVQHLGLDLGREVGVGADRARDGADGDPLPGGGQPAPVAVEGEGVAGQLEAEGGRLGRHPVGAAQAQGVAVLQGPV